MMAVPDHKFVSPWPEQVELACGPLTAIDLALFAAASGDHNPLHLDADVARAAGFDKPVVHGMLTMALAGRLFTYHFGPGCVQRLQTRFLGVVKLGESLHLTATRATPAEAGAALPARYTVQVRTPSGREVAAGEATLVRA